MYTSHISQLDTAWMMKSTNGWLHSISPPASSNCLKVLFRGHSGLQLQDAWKAEDRHGFWRIKYGKQKDIKHE